MFRKKTAAPKTPVAPTYAPAPSPAPAKGRKTLIFHIGDHKTGSTSIQLAFAKGRVSLKDRSLFYPAKLASNVLGDQCMNYHAAQTDEDRAKAAQPLERLAARVAASDADFVLISAEAIETVPAAVFRDITDRFFADSADEIRIIGYVRPHAARITSSFAERTKVGVPRALKSDLDQFAANKQTGGEFIYLPRFTAWREAYGDAFTLRPMVRGALYRKSVVDDFIHYAFGGLEFEITGTDAANESLCVEDLMRLKVLQRHLSAPRDLRLKVGWEIARIIGQMPPPPQSTKIALHKTLARDIQKAYMDDARAMDDTFFDGVPLMQQELQAAVDKALDKPQSARPADYLSPSEMRSLDLMSRMIGGLLENDEVNWPAFLHGKRLRDVQGEPAEKGPNKGKKQGRKKNKRQEGRG